MIFPTTTRAQQPSRSLIQRRSVHDLTEDQLETLREAFRAAMSVSDNRGYNFHAGIHGLPLGAAQSAFYCRHDLLLWLAWHRAYLYLFELALRDHVPDASLPWWDWASPISHSTGIPEAFASRNLEGGQGNPLFAVPIPENAKQDAQRFGMTVIPDETYREVSRVDRLPDAEQAVRERIPTLEEVMQASDFLDFSGKLRQIHNHVHVWVGGTMGDVPFAAYDPVFWVHHTMVDRVWRLWQMGHPGASFDLQTMGQALEPFPLTVGEVLDVTKLGYEYAAFSASVAGTR